MTDGTYHVFLSHSRNDPVATADLRAQLRQHGLDVFKDDESIEPGDAWLDRLQSVLEGCGSFVVLIGRDGVRRWIGAETQVALNRHFGPHDDRRRLPIFPILLDGIQPEMLPAFLRLFQVTRWNPGEALPADVLAAIRERNILRTVEPIASCPFVGLAAFGKKQAHLFFGRQRETLDALACFSRQPVGPRVKWLEINGNSGSGKSSLTQAGMLPLIEQGWLWARTGYERWKVIGPMIPGARPVEMLAEKVGQAFGPKMAEVHQDLQDGADALRFWLRDHNQHGTAFLLAIDQFEELFTFSEKDEREQFDRLVATAIADPDCPLFVISTVRADFLDRFEDLAELRAIRNRVGRQWTLAPIGAEGLREIIQGPADIAELNVSEIKDWMVEQARGEPGALPLVENALFWLWQQRTDNRLCGRQFTDQGGLAGILSRGADDLLASLDTSQREQALALLFRLVRVDRESSRHARRSIGLDEAVIVAGGGETGHDVVHRLSGRRRLDGSPGEGPLRLITVVEGRVNLIHETLIRSKGPDDDGKPQPYWPTLWDYIERHKERAVWRERLREDTAAWLAKGRNAGHQWSHERVREAAGSLRPVTAELSKDEREFLGPIDPESMLAELMRPETSHRQRDLIGKRLAMLGDPRSGVGVDANGTPMIEWCPVPAGDVTITVLADPHNPYSPVVRKGRRHIEMFLIARYPVTVAQYRGFCEANDGWRNSHWWSADLYRDPEGNDYDMGQFGNHPAAYVNWFDAVAFCRWLSARLESTIFLPDEWQWQQAAAAGRDENAFPWGEDWDPKQEPHRANTLESRLLRATAVGMYPAGASPVDADDIAGNIGEWCANKFRDPNITQSRANDFSHRAVRGGSSTAGREGARATYRILLLAGNRISLVGFRVACSLSIFER